LTKFRVVSSQCTMPLQNGAILLYVTVYEYFHLRQISKQLGCYSHKMKKKVLRVCPQLKLVRLQTLTKSPVVSSQCPMPLQNGAILLYVTVYEYYRLRQISKQLGCYSPKMKKSSENLSSVEFSEASKFDKIPSCIKSVHHAITELSNITLCYSV